MLDLREQVWLSNNQMWLAANKYQIERVGNRSRQYRRCARSYRIQKRPIWNRELLIETLSAYLTETYSRFCLSVHLLL